MGEIVVVRHGQTEWSRSGQHTGVTDLPLLPEGEDDRPGALRPVLAGRDIVATSGSARGSGPGARPSSPGCSTAPTCGSTTTSWRWTTAATRAGRRRRSAPSSAGRGRCGPTARRPAKTPGETLGRGRPCASTGCSTGARPLLADGDVALVAHGHVLRILTARWLGLAPEAGALFPLRDRPLRRCSGYEHDRPALSGWNTACP